MTFNTKNKRYSIDLLNDARWYKDNKVDRKDGPAIVYYDGHKYWYRNGVFIRYMR